MIMEQLQMAAFRSLSARRNHRTRAVATRGRVGCRGLSRPSPIIAATFKVRKLIVGIFAITKEVGRHKRKT